MHRKTVGLLGVALVAGSIVAVAPTAFASAPTSAVAVRSVGDRVPTDDLPSAEGIKARELRQAAVQGVLNGQLTPQKINGSTVVKLGSQDQAKALGARLFQHKDKFVELSREKTDRIFVVLVEFGNERDPAYPDVDTNSAIPGPARFDGPLVNQIPQPNRAVDNSTVWQSNFSREHFQDLYFGPGESLKNYYEAQSSGRYSVSGTVTDWVKVNFNEARYGRSDGFPCPSNICVNVWDLVRDGANAWVAAQLAQGRTLAQVRAELATFDVWDRYDHDDDGNFNESDGYIDHFQIVHAGGDQADGDPIYGEDAIWSHRSYAYQNLRGDIGPPGNPDGGTPVADTGIWIGDYTMQPENGGRSVFYHEYGHDLGLPDDYNSIAGGDNNNEHWTLMAQSRLGGPNDEAIGERGGDLGAWNKLQLGWLNAVTVKAGQTKVVNLGPQEYNTNKAQGIVVVLPKKVVTTQYGVPAGGAMQWYSGDGNNLENTMTRQVTLGAGAATLSFQARWDIEDCGPDPCDYAFVEVDDGSGWTAVAGNITQSAEGNGIDGTQATNVPATFDLSAYAGKTIGLRFRYSTDPAAAGNSASVLNGIVVDEITLTSGGSTVFTDGAESGANGWTLGGFTAVGTSASQSFDNFYIAGYRSYVGFDQYLKTGPYYFGYQNTRPDFVDHYAYQPGLLISYWDTSFRDNDTTLHPGSGRNLYVDAHPQPMLRADGVPWRARVQVYDAPFSQRRSDTVTLHHNSVAMTFGGLAAQPLFDDRAKYFYDELPNHGVKLPAVGVKIRVLATVGTTMVVLVS